MGNNFYTRINECDKCGRYNEIHLGKSSAGWQFSFQYNGGKFYKDIKEMKAWLKGKQIWDEYGEKISYKRFWQLVASKQKWERLNHSKEYPGNTLLIDGYSFSDYEFS